MTRDDYKENVKYQRRRKRGRITPQELAELYKKNRDLDEYGNPIHSVVLHDQEEEFFWWAMDTMFTFVLSFFVIAVSFCIICRKCIRKPAVSETSTLMRSFVQSEVNRRSMFTYRQNPNDGT